MEELLQKKDEQIERLKTRIEIFKLHEAQQQERYDELEFKYNDLKTMGMALGKNTALILHYKKYMEHYLDLYEKIFARYIQREAKYGRFYEQLDREIEVIHSSESQVVAVVLH